MLVAILTTSLMGACLSEDYDDAQEAPEYIMENDRLPRFNVTMNDGTTLTTADLTGRWSMIVLFSTSCDDCKKLLPVVSVYYRDYAQQHNINVICIAREEKKEQTERFWNDNCLTVPYTAPESREIYNLFATRGVPRVYIADKNGMVAKVFRDDNPPTLEQMIAHCKGDGQE